MKIEPVSKGERIVVAVKGGYASCSAPEDGIIIPVYNEDGRKERILYISVTDLKRAGLSVRKAVKK